MKFAVIVFPGSNCDMDMLCAITDCLKEEAVYVRHTEKDLTGFDAVLIPGGFSYGDYLRCGAIARFSTIMPAVIEFANEGKPVLGVCNGFQILLEAGLLPGALKRNDSLHFICQSQPLIVENNQTIFTNQYEFQEKIALPIAHGEGSYYCDEKTLAELKENQQIVFTYDKENPNGSMENIAGIVNKEGNVLGMMPHPERAVESILGSIDGLRVFTSMKNAGKVTV